MKQILLFIFLSILFTSNLSAQYKFDEVIYDPQRMIFYDVAVYSENNSIAVGQYGTIQLITDTAKTSRYLLLKEKKDLFSVVYASHSDIVTVGDDGVIYLSTDFGNNWELLNSPTGNKLVSLIISKNGTGFAVGSKGTILKTTDRGRSWKLLKSDVTIDLKEISISSNSIIYVVGDNGTFIKSTDMGSTWKKIEVPTTANLYHVKAFTNKIYLMGDSLRVLISDNQGATWTMPVIEPKPESYFYRPRIPSYFFENENRGIIKVFYPYYTEDYDYITTNGGISWTREKKESYSITLPDEPICFDLANEDFGILYDAYSQMFRIDYKKGRINNYHISSPQDCKITNMALCNNKIALLSKVWSVSGVLHIVQSDLNLKDWNKITNFDTIGIRKGYMAVEDMAMPKENVIILAANSAVDTSWEVGSTSYYGSVYKGFILKSDDYGKSWKKIDLPKNEPAYQLSMYDENYGLLMVGNTKNRYFITHDGGNSWNSFQVPDTSTINRIYSLDCPSPYLHILVIDDVILGKSIYKVYNEGQSWKKAIKLADYSTHTKYINEANIISVGYKSDEQKNTTIYFNQSRDEGKEWKTQVIDSGVNRNYPHSFAYNNEKQFMFNTRDYFYITNNGGESWDKISLIEFGVSSAGTFSSIMYYDDNSLLCGGWWGKLYKFLIDKSLFVEIDSGTFPSTMPYPNPTSNVVNFTLNDNLLGGRWEIMDLNGKKYMSGNIENKSEIQINLDNLPPQIYLITFTNGNNIRTEKIVKI